MEFSGILAGTIGVLWVEAVACRGRLERGEDPFLGNRVLFSAILVVLVCVGGLLGPVLGDGVLGALGIGTVVPAGPRGVIAASSGSPRAKENASRGPHAEDGGLGAFRRTTWRSYVREYFR